jgi:hypothetical protein
MRRIVLIWLQLTSGWFQKSKSVLKAKRFSDVEDIKLSVQRKLTDNPVKEFKNCFEQWPKR